MACKINEVGTIRVGKGLSTINERLFHDDSNCEFITREETTTIRLIEYSSCSCCIHCTSLSEQESLCIVNHLLLYFHNVFIIMAIMSIPNLLQIFAIYQLIQSTTSKQAKPSKRKCNTNTRDTINFGYYQSWAIYRPPNCHPVTPDAIEVGSFGYTHLAFSFAGISAGSGTLEPYNGNSEYISMYKSFNGLKETNPELKTLIAVGGW